MTLDYLEMAPETYTLAERNINALIRDNQGVVDVLMVDQVENGVSLCEAIKQGAKFLSSGRSPRAAESRFAQQNELL